MKHTISIEPPSHKGWVLEYNENSDQCFYAKNPEKPRVGVYSSSLAGLIKAIDKRDDGMRRLIQPIPVALKSFNSGGRSDGEVFAYDNQCFFVRSKKGEVGTEFFSNLDNGNSISLRLRDENYPELLAKAIVADNEVTKAIENQRRARSAFTEVTSAAIKSSPFIQDDPS